MKDYVKGAIDSFGEDINTRNVSTLATHFLFEVRDEIPQLLSSKKD
jgi:hypothetical protein